ncbi:MAG: hypothetical protein ACFFCW_26285 [Candidatus Hodarchaeota archaeon]
MSCPDQSMQRILRYTQDRPFVASTQLSINPELCRWIDPEPIDVAQGRWVDRLRAADLRVRWLSITNKGVCDE